MENHCLCQIIKWIKIGDFDKHFANLILKKAKTKFIKSESVIPKIDVTVVMG